MERKSERTPGEADAVKSELEASLTQCRNMVADYRSKLTANSDDAPADNDDEPDEAGRQQDGA